MRKCGDCQLCCKLLPVQDFKLRKEAGKKCEHQKHGLGCKVHDTRNMPSSCRLWKCRWLEESDTLDLQRPDRVHYVIDIMPDFVHVKNNETGVAREMEVIQVWLDPKFPNAIRDPGLARFLNRQRKPALVRLNDMDAFLLAPPSIIPEGKWVRTDEVHSPPGTQPHSLRQIAEKLGGSIDTEKNDKEGMDETTINLPDGRKIVISSVSVEIPDAS